MDLLGKLRVPFLCVIDFEMEQPHVFPIHELPEDVKFNFNGARSHSSDDIIQSIKPFHFSKEPISLDTYTKGFETVMKGIKRGDSFLINLTFPTEINSNFNLDEIYSTAEAKYKLKFFDEWVVFSPEPFVKITDGKIYTYPMKGTIDASVNNAVEVLKKDAKEIAEHNTIIDLLRNDLSRVARKVHVSKYRYLEHISTHQKSIYQASSEISGTIKDRYRYHLGQLIMGLLPAGSVSGAPKDRTCEIIRKAEIDKRGFYTGIAVYYDGKNIDSCVLIRYIEERDGKMIARSGGGITFMSKLESEYQELIDKVYVPINRNHQNRQWSSDEHLLAQPAI